MLSRRSSVSSIQSLKSGGVAKKTTAFICRHDSTTSRLNAQLSQIPLDPKLLKTRKCFECQTATATGTMTLLTALMTTPSSPGSKLEPGTAKQGAQLLFERLASQRKKTDGGFKDQWPDVELAFATFCYRRVAPSELAGVCQGVKAKFGTGVGRQLLRTLAEAACRDNEVWEPIEPAGSPLFASLNAFIGKLRAAVAGVERFAQVEEMFACAQDMGKLGCETVSVLSTVDVRLARCK
ncbi:hypothetical protein F5Y15DRAFT_427943 [Xylariaceae sp. FL0016]|nr:hypothetical protein F5Y15DRAFT_427943 [Xylariaceae sp. FL0016]